MIFPGLNFMDEVMVWSNLNLCKNQRICNFSYFWHSMINFEEFELNNGLRVIVHEDQSIEQAVVNILYDVGSRDEDEDKTGFAHLFEHLMFGGSQNIPSYDEQLQNVGGDNNAFTSTDITNYYLTLPANNLETAFWLESDRMLSLSFDPKVLEVQQNVVIEEFKQRYLDQPYGDVWLKLRPEAYKKHPYRWATIGKEISHIEEATMDDVRNFFYKYYRPNNATLVVGGKVRTAEVRKLAQKWFGPIPAGDTPERRLPQEPEQVEKRALEVKARVPQDVFYKVYHMPGRFDDNYLSADLLSDILGRGNSSILYQNLVKDKKQFSAVSAYVTGSIDPGLLVVTGRPSHGISLEEAEGLLDEELTTFISSGVEKGTLDKAKNQAESTHVFSEVEVLNRCMNLAFSKLSGDTARVNSEVERIRSVSTIDVEAAAANVLQEKNSTVLYYKREN